MYWRGSHLGHVTQIPEQTFVPPPTRNLASISQVVLVDKMFENDDEGWTMDGWLYCTISSSSILTFMSKKNRNLGLSEPEKSCIS